MASSSCVRCGKNTTKPVLVIYGDDAIVRQYEGREQPPFAVCPRCFEESEYVEGQEWVHFDDPDRPPELRTFTIHRYKRTTDQ